MPLDNERISKLKQEIMPLFEQAGSNDINVAAPAQKAIAAALQVPLRQAVPAGDIVSNIFATETYNANQVPEYPIDLIRPGTEGEYTAFTMPSHGLIPMRRVEGDRVFVTTYRIANGIDCELSLIRRSNWDVVRRMMQWLEAGMVKKRNDDGWHVLIAAGNARNILGYDSDASAGQFTPRLVSILKTVMRRNGGGNSSSINRGKLTDLYVSPESKDDIRAWSLNLVPDAVRANIYYASDNGAEVMKVYDVNIHDIDELGVGQEYQNYFTSTLGKSLASGDVELVVGLDLSSNDSFVMPETMPLTVNEDTTLNRQGLFGLWAEQEIGVSCLDLRRVLLGSL